MPDPVAARMTDRSPVAKVAGSVRAPQSQLGPDGKLLDLARECTAFDSLDDEREHQAAGWWRCNRIGPPLAGAAGHFEFDELAGMEVQGVIEENVQFPEIGGDLRDRLHRGAHFDERQYLLLTVIDLGVIDDVDISECLRATHQRVSLGSFSFGERIGRRDPEVDVSVFDLVLTRRTVAVAAAVLERDALP